MPAEIYQIKCAVQNGEPYRLSSDLKILISKLFDLYSIAAIPCTGCTFGTLNPTAPKIHKFLGPRRPSMQLRPLQDRVLIRRVEPEAKTAGGIFIPDTATEKPMEGEVVAVGPVA